MKTKRDGTVRMDAYRDNAVGRWYRDTPEPDDITKQRAEAFIDAMLVRASEEGAGAVVAQGIPDDS